MEFKHSNKLTTGFFFSRLKVIIINKNTYTYIFEKPILKNY